MVARKIDFARFPASAAAAARALRSLIASICARARFTRATCSSRSATISPSASVRPATLSAMSR